MCIMFRNVLQGVYAPVTLLKCSLPLICYQESVLRRRRQSPGCTRRQPSRLETCQGGVLFWASAGGTVWAGVLGAGAATQTTLRPELLHSP